MGDKIAIMGAGALGSYVGAFLAREGEDVTMVDMWPEHVETMRSNGLRASGSQGDFTAPIQALHLTDVQGVKDLFDYAFISVKSYDTEWATHFIKRYVKPDGFFISLQNCWNDPVIGNIVGSHREVGCVASHIEVALWEPGHVTRGGAVGRDSGHHVFRIGEQDGQVTSRIEEVAQKLNWIDGAYATDNLWGGALGQTLPELHGQRHLSYVRSGVPGNGRRLPLQDDTDQPSQRGCQGRSGLGS